MDISLRITRDEATRAFEQAPAIMERALELKISRASQEFVRAEKIEAPKAFSTLANSLTAMRISPLHYRATSSLNYADFVHEGTRPHFPNPANLVPWVKRVLGIADDELAESKAFLIARSIARKGTRAQPYAKNTVEKMRSRVLDLLEQGVDAGLKEAFGR